jgi:hypothetical protein
VGACVGGFTRGDEFFDKADVGVVDDFGIVMAVHGGKVDDGVTGLDEGFQFGVISKICIFKRDALEFFGMEAEGVEEVCANEA